MSKLTDVETELRRMAKAARDVAPNATTVLELAADIVAGPRWTTEQPKREGWYWFRKSNQHVWQILRVIIDPDDDTLSISWSDGGKDWIENWTGQWSGPIKEPR